MSTTELVKVGDDEARPGEMTISQIISQTLKIQQCMEQVMKRDLHYGVIPGTGDKPTLLKPGAEKLCLLFRLDPEYDIIREIDSATVVAYTIRCTLHHIPTGARVASGLGSCTSREERYQRAAAKRCPRCKAETIFKSKNEGEGWYCWIKKGGCRATFKEDDPSIVGQLQVNKDPADLANTILKMACKRALVAAVLNGTAASDFFSQDLEDLAGKQAAAREEAREEMAGEAARMSEEDRARFDSQMAEATAGAPAPAPARARPVAGGAKPAREVIAKQGDILIASAQVQRLGILRREIPGWDGEHPSPEHPFSKALAAYRDRENRPIRSTNDLTFDQASNLIQRLQGLIDRKQARFESMESDPMPQWGGGPGPGPGPGQ
jgi:hypothetical protein